MSDDRWTTLFYTHSVHPHRKSTRGITLSNKKKNLNRLLSSSPLPCLCLVDPSPPPATAAATSSSLFVFSPCFLSLSLFSLSLTVSTVFTIPVSAVVPYHISPLPQTHHTPLNPPPPTPPSISVQIYL